MKLSIYSTDPVAAIFHAFRLNGRFILKGKTHKKGCTVYSFLAIADRPPCFKIYQGFLRHSCNYILFYYTVDGAVRPDQIGLKVQYYLGRPW